MKILEYAILASAEFFLFWDMAQTLDIKNHPGHFETNKILGPHPSDSFVITYFCAIGLGAMVLWTVVPSPWRNVVGIMTAVEAVQVWRNIQTNRRDHA